MKFPYAPLRSSKVAIVGFASETMGFAPYEDQDCEVWILNMLHAHVPRWDRLWELHDRATIEQETEELKRNTDHLGVLKAETKRPIYMVDVQPDIPMSKRHEIEYLTEHFGLLCEKLKAQPYFTSTFAYMIATAVLGIMARRTKYHVPERGEEIYICGVEMLNGEEYAYQRSNAEFMVGYALGKGIAVHIPPRSALLESDGMYGYANAASLELLSRMRAYYEDKKKKAAASRDQAALRRDQAKADWNTYDGSIQALDWALSHLTYLCRGGKV
jgi:hypothetical protein